MSYVTIDDLRGPDGYLDQQFTDESGDELTNHDTVLTAILARAEAFVNRYIKVPSSLAAAASDEVVLYGNGLQTLILPPYVAGSVEEVSTLSGYTVPDYIEQDGALVITDASGIVVAPYRYGLGYAYGSSVVWQQGVPYTVTATFGWSADDLAVLAEATLEIAVQLWRYRDAGGSETIGAEGAITTVRAGFTPLVKQGLDDIAQRVRGFSGGIW